MPHPKLPLDRFQGAIRSAMGSGIIGSVLLLAELLVRLDALADYLSARPQDPPC